MNGSRTTRCILQVFDHKGRPLLTEYPHFGVIGACATAGGTLPAVRASDTLGDDRMNQLTVGPLGIGIERPLRRIRPRLPAERGAAVVPREVDLG